MSVDPNMLTADERLKHALEEYRDRRLAHETEIYALKWVIFRWKLTEEQVDELQKVPLMLPAGSSEP